MAAFAQSLEEPDRLDFVVQAVKQLSKNVSTQLHNENGEKGEGGHGIEVLCLTEASSLLYPSYSRIGSSISLMELA